MKPGNEVVCVNADFSAYGVRVFRDFKQLPKEGHRYTLREVKFEPENSTYRVLLEEVVNPPIRSDLYQGMIEPGFDSQRFRVVQPDGQLALEAHQHELALS